MNGFRSVFSTLLVLVLAAGLVRADDPVLRAATAMYDGIIVETLPNGLRVVLKPVPGSSIVTTMMAYRVGSADEELDATGLSHYLEHLLFKGTDKLMPGDIDRMTQRAGGRNNAYTNEDFTNYHFDFAADQWETALAIEADRMRNVRIDDKHEFQQEKGAVVSELDMREDQPFDLEIKAILPLLFGKTGPYGHPVIGEKVHVRGATAAVIKGHYDRWYHPNNAVLIVCGGFNPIPVMARVRELFGPIPKGELPPRRDAEARKRSGKERKEIPSKFDVPRMMMGFNGVRISDADNAALDVVESILAGGRTSRLYKKLVEEATIASDVGSGNYSGRYPGWFGITLELLKDQSHEKAEAMVVAELKRLADEPVSAAELRRVQRGVVAGAVFGREGVHELADSIAHAVMQSSLEDARNYLPKVLAVTAADVQAAAKKYLNPENSVVIWSVPQSPDSGGAPGKPGKPPSRSPATTSAGGLRVEDTKRLVLPNGLTLLLLENHRLPIVVAEAYVRNIRKSEKAEHAGVANLVGSMLEEGTASRTGPAIATAIEDVGGSLSFSAAGGAVRVLTPNRSLGLELLFDSLIRPTFPPEALERVRAQTLSAIDDSERRADVQAPRRFRELLYGTNHPLSRPALGLKPVVEKLTATDLKAYHQALFVPNNTIVAIVGDFVTAEVVAEITKLTADWRPRDVPNVEMAAAAMPEKFIENTISLPDASQLYVYLGHRGIRRDDPNFYKLLVMDYVLGSGSGFTDRLSAILRDRQGLAYTVSASITDTAGEEPGLFVGYIGTFPDKLVAVKEGFLREIERIRNQTPTQDEVESAKKYLLGSLAFKFTTTAKVADQMLQIERFGLGFDYGLKFRAAVAAVTPADVQAVARKYLDPKRMAFVAAGPVTPDGKPLAAEK